MRAKTKAEDAVEIWAVIWWGDVPKSARMRADWWREVRAKLWGMRLILPYGGEAQDVAETLSLLARELEKDCWREIEGVK